MIKYVLCQWWHYLLWRRYVQVTGICVVYLGNLGIGYGEILTNRKSWVTQEVSAQQMGVNKQFLLEKSINCVDRYVPQLHMYQQSICIHVKVNVWCIS